MTVEDAIGNLLASIGARTAFYFIQKWLDNMQISISIGRVKHDYLADTFEERGQTYVGFHNGAIPIEAFSVEYDGEPCAWWNNHSTLPRNLIAGGGGNVLIRNPDPSKVIVVKSKSKVIERRRLSEFTLRV